MFENILWITVLILAGLGAGAETVFGKEHANIWRAITVGFAIILIIILTR